MYVCPSVCTYVTRTPKHSHIFPVLKSLHWFKVEQQIQYKIISITHNLIHITEPKYLHNLTYQTFQQNPFLASSVSFPSICFHQAQVCRSIIPQFLSLLMELSTNKSKILCSRHTSLHHSHQLYSFSPLQSTLSFS